MSEFLDIRLRDLQLLDRLAQLGSITAAARDLRVPKPTASRWLGQIEDRVGVALVKRSSRTVALTEQGKEFVVRARAILTAAHAAHRAVHAESPGGSLRVSVPVPMGRMLAGPVISRFRQRLPSVRLEIRLEDSRVDLVKEGFDLAIRGGSLTDSSLIGRRLTSASLWLYASARFHGDRLSDIPLVISPGDELLLRRAELGWLGEGQVVVDDRGAIADALVWGAGIGLLPSFVGQPRCEEGTLFRAHDTPVVSLPIHALYHPAQRDDRRLQILIEEIERQLNIML